MKLEMYWIVDKLTQYIVKYYKNCNQSMVKFFNFDCHHRWLYYDMKNTMQEAPPFSSSSFQNTFLMTLYRKKKIDWFMIVNP